MNKSSKKILRYYLTAKEIKNPDLIISDFFSQGLLSEHLKILKSWKKSVYSDHYYDADNFPGNLLAEYRLIIKLLGAGWLILKEKEKAHLLKKETDLTKIFEIFNLKHYHFILNQWLIFGLSMYRADDGLKIHEFVTVSKNLKKLLKACAVIYERKINLLL